MTAGQYDQGNSSVEILSSWLTLGQKQWHMETTASSKVKKYFSMSHMQTEKNTKCAMKNNNLKEN